MTVGGAIWDGSKKERVSKPDFFKSLLAPAGRSQLSYYFISMITMSYFQRGIRQPHAVQYDQISPFPWLW